MLLRLLLSTSLRLCCRSQSCVSPLDPSLLTSRSLSPRSLLSGNFIPKPSGSTGRARLIAPPIVLGLRALLLVHARPPTVLCQHTSGYLPALVFPQSSPAHSAQTR